MHRTILLGMIVASVLLGGCFEDNSASFVGDNRNVSLEPPVGCDLECEYGYIIDENDVVLCECAEAPDGDADTDLLEKPETSCTCPDIAAPVCGSDGITYGNECEAQCAAVEIVSQGECEGNPGDEDAHQEIPCVCDDVWEPVCGVDGLTYGNVCEAECAQIAVLHQGECQPPECESDGDCGLGFKCENGACVLIDPSCNSDNDCPRGYFCKDGTCIEETVVVECTEDSDCLRGFICVDGECVADVPPECQANRDCPFGYECIESECVFKYECRSDFHCPDGKVCENGFCVDSDPYMCEEYGGKCFPWSDNGMICPDGWKPVEVNEPNIVGLCGDAQNCCKEIIICSECPELWDPVCGIDGFTYANECYAGCENVEIAYWGECEDPNYCTSNRDCDYGEICVNGVCQYQGGEACYDYGGACYEPSSSGTVCPPGTEVIFTDEELCNDGAYCCVSSDPCADCPYLWDPVCGADGVTYANECIAECQGIRVAYQGECEDPNYCTSDNDCADDEVCVFGMCIQQTDPCDECPRLWSPVCGVDGETYANACFAECQGIRIAYQGECEDPNYCTSNWDCDEGEICLNGQCVYQGEEACYDLGGTCHEGGPDGFFCPEGTEMIDSSDGLCFDGAFCCVPTTDPCLYCPYLWEPVCGVDGVTYANDCLAECHGEDIAYWGECEDPDPCSECGEYYQPVCGVNGQTYENPCYARCRGVEIAYYGICQNHDECRTDEDCPVGYWCNTCPPDPDCPECSVCGPTQCQPIECPPVWCECAPGYEVVWYVDDLGCEACECVPAGPEYCGDEICPEDWTCNECPIDPDCPACLPEVCPDPICTPPGCSAYDPDLGKCLCDNFGQYPCPDDNECVVPDDCSDNEWCWGVCYPPQGTCNADGDCYGRRICVDHQCVAPECTPNNPCPDGETCENGRCIAIGPECTGSWDCAYGEQCIDGVCVWQNVYYCGDFGGECFPMSEDGRGCPDGWQEIFIAYADDPDLIPEEFMLCEDYEVCCEPIEDECDNCDLTYYEPVCGMDGQTYINECFANCNNIEILYWGACEQAECSDDRPCPPNSVCVDGVCVPVGDRCETDSDCPDDYYCENGTCQPVPDMCGSFGGECYPVYGGQICPDGYTPLPLLIQACDSDEVCCIPENTCDCPAVYDPVCGVDGQTYGNACKAECEGVEVAYDGECETGCTSDEDCENGQVCRDGECVDPVQELCREFGGECWPMSSVGQACPDGWEVLELPYLPPTSVCGVGFECCTPVDPCLCPDLWAPVCGEDGFTYANECEADCAGVGIAYDGECMECRADSDCPDGYVCSSDGTCQYVEPASCADYGGECFPLDANTQGCPEGYYAMDATIPLCGLGGICCLPEDPCSCPENWDPVCGEDGVTYSNRCMAECENVRIAYEGECILEEQCLDMGGECLPYDSTGMACPDGWEEISLSSVRICEAGYACCVPDVQDCALCPRLWEPVCGIDGQTYSNECMATCRDIEIAYDGECLTEAECRSDADCEPEEFCDTCPATVDGQCTPAKCKPDQCIVEPCNCGPNEDGQWLEGEDGCPYCVCVALDCTQTGCPEGQFCNECPLDEATGECGAPRCEEEEACICPEYYDPVCDPLMCVTYDNECFARCENASLVFPGTCDEGFCFYDY